MKTPRPGTGKYNAVLLKVRKRRNKSQYLLYWMVKEPEELKGLVLKGVVDAKKFEEFLQLR